MVERKRSWETDKKCVSKIENVLNWGSYHVEFFEFSTGESFGEVITFEEGFDFNPDLVAGGEGSFSLLYFTTQFLDSPVVLADVLALLLLVQLDEVVHYALIEVLTSQMGVPVGRNDLNNDVVKICP